MIFKGRFAITTRFGGQTSPQKDRFLLVVGPPFRPPPRVLFEFHENYLNYFRVLMILTRSTNLFRDNVLPKNRPANSTNVFSDVQPFTTPIS